MHTRMHTHLHMHTHTSTAGTARGGGNKAASPLAPAVMKEVREALRLRLCVEAKIRKA
jgi:hypothetical protein